MLFDRKHISVEINEDKLAQTSKELSILIETSILLTTSRSLKELLGDALAKVLEYFELDAGRIYLVSGGGKYLHLAAHHGVDSKGVEKLHIHESFSGKAVQTKSFIAQHISELKDKERSAFLLSKGFKIIICVQKNCPVLACNCPVCCFI